MYNKSSISTLKVVTLLVLFTLSLSAIVMTPQAPTFQTDRQITTTTTSSIDQTTAPTESSVTQRGTQLEQIAKTLANSEKQLSSDLETFINTGELSPRAVVGIDGKPYVYALLTVNTKQELASFVQQFNLRTVDQVTETLYMVSGFMDRETAAKLSGNPYVNYAFLDTRFFPRENLKDTLTLNNGGPRVGGTYVPGIEPTLNNAREQLNVNTGYSESQYNGTDITVSIVDTGTDFGNPDISDALATDENGYPLSADLGGSNIGLTPVYFDYDGDFAQTWLEMNSKYYLDMTDVDDFDMWIAVFNGLFPASLIRDIFEIGWPGNFSEAFNQSYFNITGQDIPSMYNITDLITNLDSTYNILNNNETIFSFGITMERFYGNPWTNYHIYYTLLIDVEGDGIFDGIVVDFDTSYWANWYMMTYVYGSVDPADFNITELGVVPDFDFGDERIVWWDSSKWPASNGPKDNPAYWVLGRDFNGDGLYDISLGSLATVYDQYGLITDYTLQRNHDNVYVRGIDPLGRGFGFMYDFNGHGTSTASDVASRGKVTYPLYSNSSLEFGDILGEFDLDINTTLPGIARGAKIMALNFLAAGSVFHTIRYQLGWELQYQLELGGVIYYRQTGNHIVNISSNSWGYIDTFAYGLPGLDYIGNYMDYLVETNVLNGMDGTLFVVAAGNEGPGASSVHNPTPQLGLSVAASTDNRFRVYYADTDQPTGFPAPFTSIGPTFAGSVEIDVIAPGAFNFAPAPLWYMNDYQLGMIANSSYQLFGGTSQATPLTAGALAVVWSANPSLDFLTVKRIIKVTATDLGFAPTIQGAGLVNVSAAVQLARELANDAGFETRYFDIHDNSFSYKNIALYRSGFKDGRINGSDFELNPGILLPGDKAEFNLTVNATTGITGYHTEFFNETAVVSKTLTTDEAVIEWWNMSDGLYGPDLMVQWFPLNDTRIPNEWSASSTKFIRMDIALSSPLGARGSLRLLGWTDKNADEKIQLENLTNGLSDAADDEVRHFTYATGYYVYSMYVNPSLFNTNELPVLALYDVPEDGVNVTIQYHIYETETNWDMVSFDATNGNGTISVPSGTAPGFYQGFLIVHGAATEDRAWIPVSVTVGDVFTAKGESKLVADGAVSGPRGLVDPGYLYMDMLGGDAGDIRFYPFFVSSAINDTEPTYLLIKAENLGMADLEIALFDYTGGLLAEERYSDGQTQDGKIVLLFDMTDVLYAYSPWFLVVRSMFLTEPLDLTLNVTLGDDSLLPSVTYSFKDGAGNTISDGTTLKGPNAKIAWTWADDGNPDFEYSATLSILSGAEIYTEDTFATPPTTGTSIDAWVSREFNLGDPVTWMGGDPDDEVDFDIAIFAPSSGVNPSTYPVGSDVPFSAAVSYGATAANIESGSFVAKESGTYWIAIDQWGGGGDEDYFIFTSNLQGPTFSAAASGSVDTQADLDLSDGTYKITLDVATGSNYPLSFSVSDVTIDNYIPPTLTVSTPENDTINVPRTLGETASVDFEWSVSDPNNDLLTITIQIADYKPPEGSDLRNYLSHTGSETIYIDITGANGNFTWDLSDSVKFPQGNYTIEIFVDDGTLQGGISNVVTFKVNVFDILPEIKKAPSPGFELFAVLLAGFVTAPIIVYLRKKKIL